MNPRFQPLLDQLAGQTENPARSFTLKVMPAEKVAHPFKPLSSVLPAAGRGAGSGAETADEEEKTRARLDVKREGDKVTRLSVTCSCGRMHDLDLEY